MGGEVCTFGLGGADGTLSGGIEELDEGAAGEVSFEAGPAGLPEPRGSDCLTGAGESELAVESFLSAKWRRYHSLSVGEFGGGKIWHTWDATACTSRRLREEAPIGPARRSMMGCAAAKRPKISVRNGSAGARLLLSLVSCKWELRCPELQEIAPPKNPTTKSLTAHEVSW